MEDIRFGKYIVRSDNYNLWVDEEYIPKKKNGEPGKMAYKKVAGYSRTFPELYESFVDAKLRSVEGKSVEEFLKAVSDLREEFMSFAEVVNDGH